MIYSKEGKFLVKEIEKGRYSMYSITWFTDPTTYRCVIPLPFIQGILEELHYSNIDTAIVSGTYSYKLVNNYGIDYLFGQGENIQYNSVNGMTLVGQRVIPGIPIPIAILRPVDMVIETGYVTSGTVNIKVSKPVNIPESPESLLQFTQSVTTGRGAMTKKEAGGYGVLTSSWIADTSGKYEQKIVVPGNACIERVTTVPSGSVPPTSYRLYLKNSVGYDVLRGQCLNRSISAIETEWLYGGPNDSRLEPRPDGLENYILSIDSAGSGGSGLIEIGYRLL